MLLIHVPIQCILVGEDFVAVLAGKALADVIMETLNVCQEVVLLEEQLVADKALKCLPIVRCCKVELQLCGRAKDDIAFPAALIKFSVHVRSILKVVPTHVSWLDLMLLLLLNYQLLLLLVNKTLLLLLLLHRLLLMNNDLLWLRLLLLLLLQLLLLQLLLLLLQLLLLSLFSRFSFWFWRSCCRIYNNLRLSVRLNLQNCEIEFILFSNNHVLIKQQMTGFTL